MKVFFASSNFQICTKSHESIKTIVDGKTQNLKEWKSCKAKYFTLQMKLGYNRPWLYLFIDIWLYFQWNHLHNYILHKSSQSMGYIIVM